MELFEEQVVSFGKVVRVDLRTSRVFGVKDDFCWAGGLVVVQPRIRLCGCEMVYL